MAGVDDRASAIADYGFLSDCASSALVRKQCSVDWWCVPRFDSPSVFGRLLDPGGGHWRLTPRAADSWERDYVEDSLVLRTVVRTWIGRGGDHRCVELAARRTRPRHRAGPATCPATQRGGHRRRG